MDVGTELSVIIVTRLGNKVEFIKKSTLTLESAHLS